MSHSMRWVIVLGGTLLLGIGIGFSACFAWLAATGAVRVSGPGDAGAPREAARVASSQPGPAEPGTQPGPPGTEQAGPPAAKPKPAGPLPELDAAALAALADMEEPWPARHFFLSVRGTSLTPEQQALLAKLKPGGIVLQEDNCQNEAQTRALVQEIKEAVGLGTGIGDIPLIAVDQEGGIVNRLKLKNAPSAAELGARGDLRAARQVGQDIAAACRARGIGVVFAPVLDVYEPGAKSGLATRSFGREPFLVAAMGLAVADGMMDGGVIPVVKHYPGLGGATENTHEKLAVVAKDLPAIAAMMYPFKEAVDWGVPGIMAGHIAVPGIDPAHDVRPASLSPILVDKNLREEWGFSGVVVTDDLRMGAVTESYSLEEAAVAALNAGCDAIVWVESNLARVNDICRAVEEAVAQGELRPQTLSASKHRLARWHAWLREPRPNENPLPPLPPSMAAQEEPEEPAPAQPSPEAAAPEPPPQETPGEAVPVPPPAEAPDTQSADSQIPGTYTIERGDTLTGIAARFGLSQDDLMKWNNMDDPNDIKFGLKLCLKPPEAPG